MKLSKQIDNNIWVSIDGELKQLRPLVAKLEGLVDIVREEWKPMAGRCLVVSIGEWGGIYTSHSRVSTRLCLGWIAFTWFHTVDGNMIIRHSAAMVRMARAVEAIGGES